MPPPPEPLLVGDVSNVHVLRGDCDCCTAKRRHTNPPPNLRLCEPFSLVAEAAISWLWSSVTIGMNRGSPIPEYVAIGVIWKNGIPSVTGSPGLLTPLNPSQVPRSAPFSGGRFAAVDGRVTLYFNSVTSVELCTRVQFATTFHAYE